MPRPPTAAAAALILVATGVAGACSAAEPAQTAPVGAVSVTFTEFALAVTPADAPAGPVTFFLSNAGAVKHDFVLLGPTGLDAAALPSDDGWETIDEWEVGLFDDLRGIQAGQTATLDVALTAGHYVLVCNLPDHYSAGMRANFEVR